MYVYEKFEWLFEIFLWIEINLLGKAEAKTRTFLLVPDSFRCHASQVSRVPLLLDTRYG